MNHFQSSASADNGEQQPQQQQPSVIMDSRWMITKPTASPFYTKHDGSAECCTSSSPEVRSAANGSLNENCQKGLREMNRYDAHGRIKRPMNAFMVWSQMRRAQIASKDVKMHNSQISKELGAEWRKMSNEDKAPYVNRAKELREDLLRRHPDYVYRPKRRCHGVTKNLRPLACTAPSTCQPPPSLEQSSQSRPLPSPQDVSTQIFLARIAQEQQNNMLLAAYSNQLLAATSSTTLKNSTLDCIDQEKLRSTLASISAGGSATTVPEPFNFLSGAPLLQSQYGVLGSLLSSPFSPFLFGQYTQPAGFPLSNISPIAVQK